MMDPAQKKIYFPGLNGLRFFAALAVIITHIELLKAQIGIPNCWATSKLVFNLGGLGVYFFFVLSGFLITYLLLAEKITIGTISIKDFYLRRIFRIWPIYYLLILSGFFVFPHIGFLRVDYLAEHPSAHAGTNLLFYLLMLPNLAFAMYGPVAHIGQAWSIGVEEQFYLIWPLLTKYSKNVLKTIVFLGGLILIFKTIVWVLSFQHTDDPTFQHFKSFVAMSKIECMAIGAAGGYYLFYRNEKVLSLIYHPASQLAAFALIPALIYWTPDRIQDGIHLVYSLAFLIIIVNVASNKQSFLRLENKLFDFLGRISYGIYMYHMVVIVVVLRSFRWITGNDPDSFVANLYYYLFSVLLTILVSWISYDYFEKWFIRLKVRHSKILSGSEKQEEHAG